MEVWAPSDLTQEESSGQDMVVEYLELQSLSVGEDGEYDYTSGHTPNYQVVTHIDDLSNIEMKERYSIFRKDVQVF